MITYCKAPQLSSIGTIECAGPVQVYYQCPDTKCKHEIGYCKAHGGAERAQGEMRAHIAAHARPHEGLDMMLL